MVNAVVLVRPRGGEGVGEIVARVYSRSFRAPPVRPRDRVNSLVLVGPHHGVVHPDYDRKRGWVEAARAARVSAPACASSDVDIGAVRSFARDSYRGRRGRRGGAVLARGDFELVVRD